MSHDHIKASFGHIPHCEQCHAEPNNECYITAGTIKGGKYQTIRNLYFSMVCMLDGLQWYLTTPPITGVAEKSIYAGRGTSGPGCCSLMKVYSHLA